MNNLLEKLKDGDLRSDGKANEVAEYVIKSPHDFIFLLEGLDSDNNVIRARTAHALEKICRTNPEMLIEILPKLIHLAKNDKVPMVRWHIAMIFGNITIQKNEPNIVFDMLTEMLKDKSDFVKSWAISSLCIFGKDNNVYRNKIIKSLNLILKNESYPIKRRIEKAIAVLENDNIRMPKGWYKGK